EARRFVAELIGARFEEEIYFTSGGTESDNLAILGASQWWLEHHSSGTIVTTPVEHHAVLHTCQQIERQWPISIDYLQVDENGRVREQRIPDDPSVNHFLLSVMLGNNEVGTIQPVQRLCEMAHDRGWLVHTDAVQAVGQIEVDVERLGV